MPIKLISPVKVRIFLLALSPWTFMYTHYAKQLHEGTLTS